MVLHPTVPLGPSPLRPLLLLAILGTAGAVPGVPKARNTGEALEPRPVPTAASEIRPLKADTLPGIHESRLFGRVLTRSGRTLEGYLRWDRNEASWPDFLDGLKEIPPENYAEARALGFSPDRRTQEFRVFGFAWTREVGEGGWPSEARTSIRFGHLRSVEVLGPDLALAVLKSGDELLLRSNSTDLGRPFRGVEVDDGFGFTATVDWEEIVLVDFFAPEGAPPPRTGARLFGTVTTVEGFSVRGFVAWDVDEVLASDLLDGEVGGEGVALPFGEIRQIRRVDDGAAEVVRLSGDTLILRGTNDVNRENRGIVVVDPHLGQVTVPWGELDSVIFETPDLRFLSPLGSGAWESFDGGLSLYGVVEREDGPAVEGYLRWDNDEAFTWEVLDGEVAGAEVAVEFARIRRVARLPEGGARVELWDGRVLTLTGSNDVGGGNKGIFVQPVDGDLVGVRWEDLREVRFAP